METRWRDPTYIQHFLYYVPFSFCWTHPVSRIYLSSISKLFSNLFLQTRPLTGTADSFLTTYSAFCLGCVMGTPSICSKQNSWFHSPQPILPTAFPVIVYGNSNFFLCVYFHSLLIIHHSVAVSYCNLFSTQLPNGLFKNISRIIPQSPQNLPRVFQCIQCENSSNSYNCL